MSATSWLQIVGKQRAVAATDGLDGSDLANGLHISVRGEDVALVLLVFQQ